MAVKKTTTFEQALDRLDEIIALLDNGEEPLDRSLRLFGEGAELIGYCENKLHDARLVVEKLFPDPEDRDGKN